jgi:hypothetical protein
MHRRVHVIKVPCHVTYHMANRKTRTKEGGFHLGNSADKFHSVFGEHLTSINFVEKRRFPMRTPREWVGYKQREGHGFISVPHSRNRSKNPPHPFFKINLSP